MKPFDLERALAGDPVVTRDGEPVTQLTQFIGLDSEEALFGVQDKKVRRWFLDGKYIADDYSRLDLFMAPVKREGWVNIYPKSGHSQYSVAVAGGDICATKEIAQTFAGVGCIGCARVEWEE